MFQRKRPVWSIAQSYLEYVRQCCTEPATSQIEPDFKVVTLCPDTWRQGNPYIIALAASCLRVVVYLSLFANTSTPNVRANHDAFDLADSQSEQLRSLGFRNLILRQSSQTEAAKTGWALRSFERTWLLGPPAASDAAKYVPHRPLTCVCLRLVDP